MTDREMNQALNHALKTWEQTGQPDKFTATVQPGNGQAKVHIYHHETHPSGGQTFTADITELPSGKHAGRQRIHRP